MVKLQKTAFNKPTVSFSQVQMVDINSVSKVTFSFF